jgi:hypothetical protein
MKWLWRNTERKFSSAEIEESLNKILENSSELAGKKYFELILSSIDLTILNPTDTKEQAEKLAEKGIITIVIRV